MKPRGNLDERADPSVHAAGAGRGPEDARQQLEGRRFSSPVRTDDSERLSRTHRKGHVLQDPEFLFGEVGRLPRMEQTPDTGRDDVAEAVVAFAPAELLPDTIEKDGGFH